MTTFTAAELAGLYRIDSEGGHQWEQLVSGKWIKMEHGPCSCHHKDFWRLHSIPKRVVDLSVLVNGIDCEFAQKDGPWNVIGPLHDWMNQSHDDPYESSGAWFQYCRPRHNHWMFRTIDERVDGASPLPAGFLVEWTDREDVLYGPDDSEDVVWSDAVGYRITGLSENWAYPWQEEES